MLRLLLLAMVVSPSARALAFRPPDETAPVAGVWCFAWAVLHFSVWSGLYPEAPGGGGEELVRRAHLVGFSAR